MHRSNIGSEPSHKVPGARSVASRQPRYRGATIPSRQTMDRCNLGVNQDTMAQHRYRAGNQGTGPNIRSEPSNDVLYLCNLGSEPSTKIPGRNIDIEPSTKVPGATSVTSRQPRFHGATSIPSRQRCTSATLVASRQIMYRVVHVYRAVRQCTGRNIGGEPLNKHQWRAVKQCTGASSVVASRQIMYQAQHRWRAVKQCTGCSIGGEPSNNVPAQHRWRIVNNVQGATLVAIC